MDEFDTKVLYEQVFGKAADNNPDYDRRMKRIESMVEIDKAIHDLFIAAIDNEEIELHDMVMVAATTYGHTVQMRAHVAARDRGDVAEAAAGCRQRRRGRSHNRTMEEGTMTQRWACVWYNGFQDQVTIIDDALGRTDAFLLAAVRARLRCEQHDVVALIKLNNDQEPTCLVNGNECTPETVVLKD
jgi:hypothetical protein